MIKDFKLLQKLKIKRNDLVLEIGSGANPLIRSDVLLDKFPYIIKKHRSSLRLVKTNNKPLIIGDAQELPFAENSFDWIICRHVLEHLNDPLKFFEEIKRVSKKAYIATPSPFTELVHGGYQNVPQIIGKKGIFTNLHHGKGTEGHKWFVLNSENNIYLLAKSAELYPIYLFLGYFIKNNTLYNQKKNFKRNPQWLETEFISNNLENNKIVIINDIEKNKEDFDLEKLKDSLKKISHTKNSFKDIILQKTYSIFFSSKKRYNINDILACPICKNKLIKKNNAFICEKHGKFPVINHIPVLINDIIKNR